MPRNSIFTHFEICFFTLSFPLIFSAIITVQTKGETPFRLGALKLYKRDELLAEVPQSVLINADSPIATYRFTVDSFEAGTPFFIEVEACGEKGKDTSGLVFINKVTQ